MVSGRFFILILMGYGLAVPLTWYSMNRWLDRFAYKIEIQGWIFVVTGVLVLFIAAVAMGFRALRAATANPVHAIRTE
jgi:putative ABC transport system permease protein